MGAYKHLPRAFLIKKQADILHTHLLLQAKKKLPDLKYKPTQNPLRTALEMSKMAFLTPEGDYYCVAVADGDYQYMVYSTKDGEL